MDTIRDDRERIAILIEDFLLDRIDEIGFQEFRSLKWSSNATVRFACEILDNYADEQENDSQGMRKADWDYLERVRLVLLSGHSLLRRDQYSIELPIIIACLCVVILGGFVACYGVNSILIPALIVLGCLSLFLGNWLERLHRRCNYPHAALVKPFASFSQLASAYRSTDNFTKNKSVRKEKERGPQWYYWLVGLLLIPIMSPITLVLLSLPMETTEYFVKEQ